MAPKKTASSTNHAKQNKAITRCRVCHSSTLTHVMNYGGLKPETSRADLLLCDQKRYPNACGLLQRRRCGVAAPLRLSQGVGEKERLWLRQLVGSLNSMTGNLAESVLDIGYGDGSLLSYFPSSMHRIGIDWQKNAANIDAWADEAYRCRKGLLPSAKLAGRHFSIITQIGRFARYSSPVDMARFVKKHLDRRGLWAVETPYLPLLATRGVVEAFNPEQCCYLTLSTMGAIAAEAGLKIVRMEFTGREGGSAQFFLTHHDEVAYDIQPWLLRLARIWDEEASLFLPFASSYQAFTTRIHKALERAQHLVANSLQKKEKIHLLGVGAQTDALARILGLTKVDSPVFLVSRQPLGWGGHSPLNRLPILTPGQSQESPADLYIVPRYWRPAALQMFRENILQGARMLLLSHHADIVDKFCLNKVQSALFRDNCDAYEENLHGLFRAERLRPMSV